MKRKGFTLVELLAVIAILAILVIIALPNVMGMFKEAKKNSFATEIKEIFKVAEQEWMNDSMVETKDRTYARSKTATCNNSLNLNGRTNIEYYIVVDKSGKVTRYYATDGTYEYSYRGNGLQITEIDDIDQLDEADEDRFKISCSSIVDGELIKIISQKTSGVISVGDEVSIGSEHFYVVDSNNNETKLLAKYNLDEGQIFYKIWVTNDQAGRNECYQYKNNLNGDFYCDTYAPNENGKTSCICSSSIRPYTGETYELLQSSQAIGAHGSEIGEPEFPEYGVVSFGGYYIPTWGTSFVDVEIPQSNYNDTPNYYLKLYKNYFDELGVDIKKMDLLSIYDIDKIVYSETNQHLPLTQWYSETHERLNYYLYGSHYIIYGSIKDKLNGTNPWIYSTTYWTKTFDGGNGNEVFVDTLGHMCSGANCHSLGAGIRPLLVIDTSMIEAN